MRLVVHSPNLDVTRRNVTDDPSPTSMKTWLDAVDQGDVAALVEMQEEMEAKSAHLQGVAEARRAALTGLDWVIEPDEDAEEPGQAKLAANYCREQLGKVKTWETTLETLADAIGPNIGVVELIWHRGELVRTVDVPGHRLTRNTTTRTGAIAVITDDNALGVSTLCAPYKFAVYHPRARGRNSLRRTLTHACVWPYLVSHFGRADWSAWLELYGTPLRAAYYEDGVTPKTKTEVDDMLQQMGSDVAGHFPNQVKIELLQASGEGNSFEKALAWAENKIAILWLGQTLTTDIGNVGSRAAAEVHERVKASILFGDIKSEKRFVREQVLRPMVRLRFPSRLVPVPHFVRQLVEEPDTEGDRLRMDQFKMAIEAKAPIDVDEFYEGLRIKKPLTWPKDQKTIGASVTPEPSEVPE